MEKKKKRGKRPPDPYDRLIRFLMQKFSRDLATWLLGEGVREVREVDTVLSSSAKRFTDIVTLVTMEKETSRLLHVEFQIAGSKKIPRRFLEYAALLFQKLEKPEFKESLLQCAVIYLDRSLYRKDTGRFHYQGPWTEMLFTYRVIEIWNVDPEPILAMESPGLCPFVPLMRGNPGELMLKSYKRIISTPDELVSAEVKAELCTALGEFSERVIKDTKTLEKCYSEIEKMAGGYFYNRARGEGEAIGLKKGRKEGRQEGELIMARRGTLKVLTARFGALPDVLTSRIESTTDVEELERLLEKAVVCASLEELL
jgi:predicted transposase/invertase (TIGR01784 family)